MKFPHWAKCCEIETSEHYKHFSWHFWLWHLWRLQIVTDGQTRGFENFTRCHKILSNLLPKVNVTKCVAFKPYIFFRLWSGPRNDDISVIFYHFHFVLRIRNVKIKCKQRIEIEVNLRPKFGSHRYFESFDKNNAIESIYWIFLTWKI